MSAPIYYPGHVLEDAAVTVPGEASGFSKNNLTDRNIISLWKDTDITGTRIIDGQKVGNTLQPDTLILPGGHGYAGLSLVIRSSPDGITYTTRLTTTPPDGNALRVALSTTVLVDYWRAQWSGAAAPVYVAEVILAAAVTPAKVPSQVGLVRKPLANVVRTETRGGNTLLSQRGASRWGVTYPYRRIVDADRALLEPLWTTGKPFYVLDHTGTLRWVTILGDPQFTRAYGVSDVWDVDVPLLEAQPL